MLALLNLCYHYNCWADFSEFGSGASRKFKKSIEGLYPKHYVLCHEKDQQDVKIKPENKSLETTLLTLVHVWCTDLHSWTMWTYSAQAQTFFIEFQCHSSAWFSYFLIVISPLYSIKYFSVLHRNFVQYRGVSRRIFLYKIQ